VRNTQEKKELDEIEEVNEVAEAEDLIGCEVALLRQERSTRTVGRRDTPPPPCFL
jgi:hypothetical protein